MGRSGYDDYGDEDPLAYGRWRQAVRRALEGRRGQAFLREMADALDAIPEKQLVDSVLVCPDGCCAMGAVALKRGADTSGVDETERDDVAEFFGIAPAMAAEIAYINDEGNPLGSESREQRWQRVRDWVARQIKDGAQ